MSWILRYYTYTLNTSGLYLRVVLHVDGMTLLHCSKEMTESTAWIRKIIVIAVLTRLVVLSVGIATFCLIPSWDTSQTLRPSGEAGLAGGIRSFVNWDGEYFLHVSKHGYTNEKLHAFFPGLPVAIIVVK